RHGHLERVGIEGSRGCALGDWEEAGWRNNPDKTGVDVCTRARRRGRIEEDRPGRAAPALHDRRVDHNGERRRRHADVLAIEIARRGGRCSQASERALLQKSTDRKVVVYARSRKLALVEIPQYPANGAAERPSADVSGLRRILKTLRAARERSRDCLCGDVKDG